MHYVTFALLFVTWAELAYLFLLTEHPKVLFLATVKAISHQKRNWYASAWNKRL